MQQTSLLRKAVASGIAAATLALGMSAISGASTARPHIENRTITAAESPSAQPTYIFPFVNCNYFSVSNLNQFQELMYRPLYWFGLGASSAYQASLSTANTPKWTGSEKVTIAMKGWKFSDGQTVDAQSVMFFLNMYKGAVQNGNIGNEYCGYNVGYGIPDQVKSVSSSNTADTVTITFKSPINANWLLYNYLSEITPMPTAWDTTNGTNSGGCSTAAYGSSAAETDCQNVYNYLNGIAQDQSKWSGSLWGVVDGPWKIASADTAGNVDFVPNSTYSGPQKAQVSNVDLKAYTSTSAEETDLESGSGPQLGFVDPTDLPVGAPKPGGLGPNLPALKNTYNLTTGSTWSFNYIALMFAGSGTTAGSSDNPTSVRNAELAQLYVRQALQEGIDQNGIIANYFENYGEPTCSPLPPKSPTSISANVPCAYKFGIHTAQLLLEAHGWQNQSGNMVCIKPGTASSDCGSGIPNNAILKFNYSFLTTAASPAAADAAELEITDWNAIGFQIEGDPQGFNTAISSCFSENMCSWGGGWIYAPDYYPSGESLFATGGSFNLGNYNNATMNSDIAATTSGKANLTAYEKYAAAQLPVLYVPNGTGTGEVSKSLKGIQPPNPLENFMPEYLHY
jgi:peptide/nickel transport system substrate-binding protein